MMDKNNHVLTPVWEKFPEMFSPEYTALDTVDIIQLISELFVVGDYYYFLINFLEKSLSHHSPNICAIHGLDEIPTSLQQIIALAHPDDIEFILRAEENCSAKMVEIGVEYTKSLKASYCFRMRVADGSYHLFHHQSIAFDVDAQNRIVRSLNIHTDIQHLTSDNNYIATVMGIHDRSDFHRVSLLPNNLEKQKVALLSRRELEILPLIAKGLSSRAIAEQLEISHQTVRVHRKNILRKTQTTNSSSMVKRCIEVGLL